MNRTVSAAAGGLLLCAAPASVALIGGAGTSTAAGTASSAYGIRATGALPIPATPEVVSHDGSLVTDSLASAPDNPLLELGLLEVSARDGQAGATVADLGVGAGILAMLPEDLATQLQPVCEGLGQVPLEEVTDPVTGDLLEGALEDALNQVGGSSPIDLGAVTALDLGALLPAELTGVCDLIAGDVGLAEATAVEATCTGHRGDTRIADLTALGLPVEIDTEEANATTEIPGVLTLTVNRQTDNPDGTFTVDALVLDLFGQEEVVVASATCGRVTRDEPEDPEDSDPPSPTPVVTDLPVTG
ncbi:choice-of-anchor P family protein [Nocardioides stalactiti]|uniref:choice-of-anchor P family protein n=1 Tax=Nocardioides stalactiti TaxID=2755356 RepID=UPI00160311B4|nr:choice-of-anchor P family protein [Nocardioides stalactiti]